MNLKARVGARIGELRQAKGLTQQELAARAAIDAATLSKIESGRRNITLSTLNDLLTALDVSPRHFFASDAFSVQPAGPADSGTIIDSEHLRFREVAGALSVHFPCGQYDAVVTFPSMKRAVVAEAILAMRDGLHRAELPAAGDTSSQQTLMSQAIADSFLKIGYAYPRTNPSDIWRYIIYRAFIDPLNHPTSNARKDFQQSWKRTSGWALEQILDRHYGEHLAAQSVSITSFRSNAERAPLLKLMGLAGKVPADKVDQFILGRIKDDPIPLGVLHVKTSLAERRTDDVPASRAIQDAGYLSIFVTMDAKDTPSPQPRNRGEYGQPGTNASQKRLDVELDGSFSAVFSFNANTVSSPERTPSGARIMTVNLANPADAFSAFILDRWRRVRQERR
ncbi:MAG: helix-turn-helix domain-containing protein [Planctomycetia bacterium]|nr:helix-turn-helix domain-containing protein [Planctomycetia bacterium]